MARRIGVEREDLGSIPGPSIFFVLIFLYRSCAPRAQTPTMHYHHPANGCIICPDPMHTTEGPWYTIRRASHGIQRKDWASALGPSKFSITPPTLLISTCPSLFFLFYFLFFIVYLISFFFLYKITKSFFYLIKKSQKPKKLFFFHKKIFCFFN